MTATFDVERFEHVAATAETALLRLSGRWRADQRERLSPPMLVVDDGRRTHRLAALPGPEDAAALSGPDPPRWRAALPAPPPRPAPAALARRLLGPRRHLRGAPPRLRPRRGRRGLRRPAQPPDG